MRCEQVSPYLPGLAGDELGVETVRWVEAHISECASCSREAARYRAMTSSLAALRAHEIEPPAFLAEAIAEHVRSDRRRRFLPVPPIVSPELARVVADNREAIVSAGAALVAAGAAIAVWRAARSARRPRPAV